MGGNAAGDDAQFSLESLSMSSILLIGTDAALLEGLAQSLVAAGHQPQVGGSLSEAADLAGRETPLITIADRALLAGDGAAAMGIPRLAGGALVLYRKVGDAQVTLAPALQRSVLAELTLPLERQRLLALVQSVEGRAFAAGRAARRQTPHPPAR